MMFLLRMGNTMFGFIRKIRGASLISWTTGLDADASVELVNDIFTFEVDFGRGNIERFNHCDCDWDGQVITTASRTIKLSNSSIARMRDARGCYTAALVKAYRLEATKGEIAVAYKLEEVV